ncbi:hypothetical protein QYE76_000350 [Lolium multiflorum]|uniref:FAF domain-containing protein n=1 Tax=Lolium multiflorum TaxID=4521 RepID=A0AAD8RJV8_LOLMU|nr:hypothetical protein QYE76_000350 [Lolium multiflorum]
MTVSVCHVMPALDMAPRHARMPMPMPAPPPQLDMWSAIQTNIDDSTTKPLPTPAKASYVMPPRRSMSNESLDLCTESLGSETGTHGDFLDQAAVMACLYQTTNDSSPALADSFLPPALREEEEEVQEETAAGELTEVQYHRARPQRAFPPPLPSMSRRRGDDAGPCLRMLPHRRDGRLVVEAVAVKPQGYLHARRQGGRLRLCFVDCASSSARDDQKQSVLGVAQLQVQEPQQEELMEEKEDDDEVEEEEDEVEVVDRGTVVEVMAASGKAQRCSRLVINKFVGGAPATDDASHSRCSRAAHPEDEAAPPAPGLRRVPSSATTLAAAVAAASTGMEADEDDDEADNGGQHGEQEKQSATMLLFTSRVGDREELVQSVRRCRQLRQRPLFIVEPYTIIAT